MIRKRFRKFGLAVLLGWSFVVAPTAVGAENPSAPDPISMKRVADHGAPLFTMEFRDADLKDVLRAIGQENRLNIIMSDDVQGKLTLSFQRVPLDQALEAILKINNLSAYRDGNIVRVVRSAFAEGEENLVTRMVPIHYAGGKDTAESLKSLMTKKGTVTVDSRTNTLILRDVPENVDRLETMVRKLDTRTPQVLIEARIVEANSNFTRELGVQWGGTYNGGKSNQVFLFGGATKQKSTDDFATPLTGGLGIGNNAFNVNLPAAVGAGSGGAIGLLLANAAGTKSLDLQLSALEDSGKGRILSSPRILTLDNKEAKISSGSEILIPVTAILGVSTGSASPSSGGGATGTTGVTTIEAKLELTVTPHVTPDGQIVMHVKTDKKDPDFSNKVQGIPPLSTRTAETDLLIRDGQTIVIGGIYTRNQSDSVAAVPWLSKIPLLGYFFKKTTKTDNQTELLIFITPTIYKEA